MSAVIYQRERDRDPCIRKSYSHSKVNIRRIQERGRIPFSLNNPILHPGIKRFWRLSVNYVLRILAAFLLFQCGVSCSFLSTCTDTDNYRIEYSSSGGFTGIESGITIRCNRTVIYWERKLNSSPKITDSTKLTSAQGKTFNELMKSKELYSYKNDYRGNYTTRLTIVHNEASNTFSFNPSDLPKEMPAAIKNIITEIKLIRTHK